MREPCGSVDVETMGAICGVYGKLVAKFSRLLGEARQITIRWMREERTAFYAKRLAANQREYASMDRQRRAGEIANLCLRVREWVLSCPARRAHLRALIGEARIDIWQDRRLAAQIQANNPRQEMAPIETTRHQNRSASPVVGRKTAARYQVRNWYRLPYISQTINGRRPTSSRVAKQPVHQDGHETPRPPIGGGMCRAVPAVVFWPDELAASYVHRPQTVPETTNEDCPNEGEHTPAWRPDNRPPIETPTPQEWPD